MPRHYKRKTERGNIPLDVLERAAADVRGGKSIRTSAKEYGIDRMTLTRFVVKKDLQPYAVPMKSGYSNLSEAKKVFKEDMEKDLAKHVKDMAARFHGLSPDKVKELAFEFASRNNLGTRIPESWIKAKKAVREWFLSFLNRHHISCRKPEATSMGRATAFNKHTVGEFFFNLGKVMDTFKFGPQDIFNLDESGFTTVQSPKSVVAEKGKKQIGSITSGERGQLVTVVCCVSAAGQSIPPMLIFPRVNYKDYFIKGAPTGSIGVCSKSGWINEDIFCTYLTHFISHTRCSKDHPVLLLMDNHESHISLKAIDIARENGVVMLTIPPHTSHKLQPLDKTVYGPMKTYYNRSMDAWMRSNPGKTITIYDIPTILNPAYTQSITMKNITSGFHSTGIFPFNSDIFDDIEFAPSLLTDRPPPLIQQPSDETTDVSNNETVIQLPMSSVTRNLNSSFNTSTSPSHDGYVSPVDILPTPTAGPRKQTNHVRRRGKTTILTDTPEKIALENRLKNKAQKSLPRKTVTDGALHKTGIQRKIEVSSDDSSGDFSVHDESDYESDSTDEEPADVGSREIVEGDYVLVKFQGKNRLRYFIGLVERVEESDLDGHFLRKSMGQTFCFKTEDACSFPKTDVLKLLPKPKTVGGTARCSHKYIFPCDLLKWHIE